MAHAVSRYCYPSFVRSALLLLAAVTLAAAIHPLTPLTADEISAAARVILESKRFPDSARFCLLTLDEPPKEAVLRNNAQPPRRAFAVLYDAASDRTWEAIANLSSRKLD